MWLEILVEVVIVVAISIIAWVVFDHDMGGF